MFKCMPSAQAVLATAAAQREARLFEDAAAGRGKASAQSPKQVMPCRAFIMHANGTQYYLYNVHALPLPFAYLWLPEVRPFGPACDMNATICVHTFVA